MATENASRAARCDDPVALETYMHLASVWLRLAREATAQWAPESGARDAGGADGAQAPGARTLQ